MKRVVMLLMFVAISAFTVGCGDKKTEKADDGKPATGGTEGGTEGK